MGRGDQSQIFVFKKMFLQLTAVCEQSEFFAMNVLK